MLFEAAAGDPTQRWRDKSYNAIWSKNGVYSASVDHTAIDGMVLVLYNYFSTITLEASKGKWTGSINTGCFNILPFYFRFRCQNIH